jgi:hypothetical protein
VLTKLNPAGSALLYSTWMAPYFHNRGMYEPSMIAVGGPDGAVAYVGDQSESVIAAYDTNQSGAASFLYQEFLPFVPLGMAADSAGNAYAGGAALKLAQNGVNGNQDIDLNGAQTTAPANASPGMLVRFNSAGQNTYATYFGNGAGDDVYSVAVDPDGTAYLVGNADGLAQVKGLPSGAASAYGAFVAKVDTTQLGAASLLYLTYINAGDLAAQGYGISSNGAGLIAFSLTGTPTTEYGATEQTYPLVNPLIQPYTYPGEFSSSFPYVGVVGVLDTTKAGQQALIFLSFLDGVVYPYVVDLAEGAEGENLYVGGFAGTGDAQTPFLGVASSYLSSISYGESIETSPFFYEIALGPADELEISPPFLAFPSQEEGTTTNPPLSFAITNTTSAAITISSVTASSQFGAGPCTPNVIPAGQSCTVNVTFQPNALSSPEYPTTGTITVASSISTQPLVEAVSGVGDTNTTPTASLSPQHISFGSVLDGSIGGPMQVTLTNTGSVALSGIGGGALVSLSNFPGAFVLTPPTSSPTCGSSLAMGAQCYFAVAFEPTTTSYNNNLSNNYAQQLSVNFNSTGSISMNLTGTGVVPAPAVSLCSGSLAFSNTNVGSASTKDFCIKNTGTAELTGIVPSITGANPGDFSLATGTGACGATLATNASCNIYVSFKPLVPAQLTASVSIADNAASSPQSVSLDGLGLAPEVSLSTASLVFGNTAVGQSAQKTVVVTNTGNAPLSLTKPTFTATTPAVFKVAAAATSGCGSSLAAPVPPATSTSCSYVVTYTPSEGVASNTLNIIDNSNNVANSQQPVTLSGTGTAPEATLSVNTLAFPDTQVGQTAQLSVTLTNNGNEPLNLGTATLIGGTPADFAFTTNCGATLTNVSPNNTCNFVVTFKPFEGHKSTTLNIPDNSNNVTNAKQTVSLTGTGMAPLVKLSPASLAFGSLAVGQSTTQTITLTNTGNETLSLGTAAITGSTTDNFSFTTTCGATLTNVSPNNTCDYVVTFKPKVGNKSDTLTIYDNADNVATAKQKVTLSGTGTAPEVTFSTNTLAFGTVAVDTSPAPTKTVTVTNKGNAPLSLSSALAGSSDFTIAAASTCGASLAAPVAPATSTTCTYVVTFKPTTGSNTGTLTITDNNNNVANSTENISLSGTGH